MATKVNVIYARFSTEMQRVESCEDQERDTRTGLARKGIERVDLVIRDEAESGTKADRPGFQRLIAMIRAGCVGILAVDDQSRLTRGDDAMAFIKDLVYAGGRFISTSENIDTDEEGWQLTVKVMELQNGVAIRGLSDKVRRGQRGRVLADDSAGDLPYGYESFYHDADWQEQLARRGPKPKRGIRINDLQASWVRRIFDWFIAGLSINAIARRLTKEGAPKGHRATTPGWHPQQVRRILNNSKYVGEWRWGETTTIRDSRGRTKQVPVAADEVVVRERPNLRIIDQDVWDRAQARLRKFLNQFGRKRGQAKRGPKAPVNPASEYPRSLLGGVLRCAACGQPMWKRATGGRLYYTCSWSVSNRCNQSFQVPAKKAEEAVIDAITCRMAEWPDWLRVLHARLTEILVQAARQVAFERVREENQLAELTKRHGNTPYAVARN